MKKKHVGKSIISMLLVVSLVLGMIGIMPKGQEVEAADTANTSTEAVKLADSEEAGYTQLTFSDFGISNGDILNQGSGHKVYSLSGDLNKVIFRGKYEFPKLEDAKKFGNIYLGKANYYGMVITQDSAGNILLDVISASNGGSIVTNKDAMNLTANSPVELRGNKDLEISISCKYENIDGTAKTADLVIGVWINGELQKGGYIYAKGALWTDMERCFHTTDVDTNSVVKVSSVKGIELADSSATDYEQLTFSDFGIYDNKILTQGSGQHYASKILNGDLDEILFQGKYTFPTVEQVKEFGQIYIGLSKWYGIILKSDSTGNILVQVISNNTVTYKDVNVTNITAKNPQVSLRGGKSVKLGISVKYENTDASKGSTDVKIGVWINDVLSYGGYIYVQNVKITDLVRSVHTYDQSDADEASVAVESFKNTKLTNSEEANYEKLTFSDFGVEDGQILTEGSGQHFITATSYGTLDEILFQGKYTFPTGNAAVGNVYLGLSKWYGVVLQTDSAGNLLLDVIPSTTGKSAVVNSSAINLTANSPVALRSGEAVEIAISVKYEDINTSVGTTNLKIGVFVDGEMTNGGHIYANNVPLNDLIRCFHTCDSNAGNSVTIASVKEKENKNIATELAGYRKITLADYGFDVAPATKVTTLTNASGYATALDFHKTYLDIDVNLNANASTGPTTQYIQYQGNAKYNNCICISSDGAKIKVWQYVDASKTDQYPIASFTAAKYGVTSFNEYFNLKIRTDIEANASDKTKEIMSMQIWINNQLAYEGAIEQVAHQRTGFFSVGENILAKSSLDIDEALNGYKRVTAGDFDGVGASKAEGVETTYTNLSKGGKYAGSSLHRTYLDMDVSTSSDFFMHYPMSEEDNGTATFYGTHMYYRFSLSGTTLSILPVVSGKGGTAKTINISNYGYTSGSFNLKIKTDIVTNASDSTKSDMGLQIWINDNYAGRLSCTETTYSMMCLGLRGNANSSTFKTPIVYKKLKDVTYDLSKGAYLLTGGDSFIVNGESMTEGSTLGEPKDYIIETIVDGEVVSKQCVSLYYLGDVNLDGNAFEVADTEALNAMVNGEVASKAALKAADMNNDEMVSKTDLTVMNEIMADATKKDEILAKYHVPALTYDVLGGDEVMPIAGFYGPYNDANITDKVYKWIKDAGINLITYYNNDYNNDPNRVLNNLALAEKYGIGLYIKDSGTNTITTDENGNVTGHSYLSSASDIAERLGNYSRFSSFLGMSIVDEPKSKSDSTNKSYTYYEKFAEALKPYSNITGYINLNGSVAVDKGAYESYLKEVAPDVKMLSFDNYPLYDTVGNNSLSLEIRQLRRLQTYLESLDAVRQVAKDNNIPFMSYVQAGSDYRDDKSTDKTTDVLSEAETQWIVNTSLAYGAKGIAWFPLLQPEYFSYDSTDTENDGHDYDRNGIIGANNEKNAYYTIVQKTNKQIEAIDEVLMKANNTGVIVTGKAATDIENTVSGRDYTFTGIKEKADGTYTTQLKDVTTGDKGAMVGCFDYRDSEAFYVVNYDTTQGATQTITLTFNGSYQYRLIQDAKTTYGNGETVTLTIPAGAGVLVVLEDHIVEYTAAEFATYRTGETFIAPEAPVGYVFAGWFTNASCTSAVPMNAKTVSVEKVYAKFVDENLLNVKAQILANTERDSKTTDIRFVFAVDTLSYSKIGFLIKQGDKVRDRSNNKVYATLSAYDEYGKTQAEFTPQNVFCETATRFKTWTITGVPNTSFETPFEVTAYWITKDGTKVCSPQATKIIFDAIQ